MIENFKIGEIMTREELFNSLMVIETDINGLIDSRDYQDKSVAIAKYALVCTGTERYI